MIVKNESALLAECLDSIHPIAREICVVDTGSTDDTIAIARDHGCRLTGFPWANDFSAARNASLAMCTSPWIFVLDADERIAPADLARLQALTEAGPASCFRFVTYTTPTKPTRVIL